MKNNQTYQAFNRTHIATNYRGIRLAIDLEESPMPEWIDDDVEDAMEM